MTRSIYDQILHPICLFSSELAFTFGGLLYGDRWTIGEVLEGLAFFFTGVTTFTTGVFLVLGDADLSFGAMVEFLFIKPFDEGFEVVRRNVK